MQERKTNGIGYLAGDWPLDPEKSTIVFIHGAGGSSLFWQAQVKGLVARANTIAIDLPGRGRSGNEGRNTVEDYAEAVVVFIKEINAPNPIPCGLSMGGAVTQQLLLDYQDLFKAGVLISTGSRLKVTPVIFETIEKDYHEFVNMIGKLAASKNTDPGLVEPFQQDTARCKAETTHGDFRACDSFDASNHLSSIEVPVLVVTAEDDRLTPPKYGDFLEKHIKNASRAHIKDAGHIVPIEKPDEINKAILKFLDQTGL
jgi:pimeloyl-ACP methyl ester carboxylesterase